MGDSVKGRDADDLGADFAYSSRMRVNFRQGDHRALGLCLSNRNRPPPASIDHGIATHPHVRITDSILLENPFYEDLTTAMTRRAQAFVKKKMRRLDSRARRLLARAARSDSAGQAQT